MIAIYSAVLLACLQIGRAETMDKDSLPEGYQSVSQVLKYRWQGIPVTAGALPQKSRYKIAQEGPQGLDLGIYPHVGEHYLLRPHDFEVFIRIEGAAGPPKKIPCVRPKGFDDLRDETFERNGLKVTIGSRVHYTYHGEPGSNPNPYTPEVMKILLEVIRSIRIGSCSG